MESCYTVLMCTSLLTSSWEIWPFSNLWKSGSGYVHDYIFNYVEVNDTINERVVWKYFTKMVNFFTSTFSYNIFLSLEYFVAKTLGVYVQFSSESFYLFPPKWRLLLPFLISNPGFAFKPTYTATSDLSWLTPASIWLPTRCSVSLGLTCILRRVDS